MTADTITVRLTDYTYAHMNTGLMYGRVIEPQSVAARDTARTAFRNATRRKMLNIRGDHEIVVWDVEMTVADAITTGWLIRDRLSWPHDEADYDAVSTFVRALLVALHGWVHSNLAVATA